MPLTMVCANAFRLFAVPMPSFGGSIHGRFCCGPSDPGDRDVVDEPGDERHDDCPSESVILQDCCHDAAPAADCGYPVGFHNPAAAFEL
jgi:hypothetical protein